MTDVNLSARHDALRVNVCLWVPANLFHQLSNIDTAGLICIKNWAWTIGKNSQKNKFVEMDVGVKQPIARYIAVCVIVLMVSCSKTVTDYTRVSPPLADTRSHQAATPGSHELNLGATLFINGKFAWRDGILFIPDEYDAQPIPLLVWLHGGGGHAKDAEYMFAVANHYGVALLAIDSRHNTWDGIDSPFGPDVKFIEKALAHTFRHISVDTKKLALGGLSDGASYILTLGRCNGDVFTHLIAAAPWRLRVPCQTVGKPSILVVHGTEDNIYPAWHSRQWLVPALKDAGYTTAYLQFKGPHWVPAPVLSQVLTWFLNSD